MKVAVEGCCHGELDAIYETLELLQKKNNFKVDLLLICGDFQSVRNKADLECMAVPPKHRKMNSFYKYYSGEKVAPVLTLFIGGNHEASNYLQSLPYGGWVAPKIYYMGYASVVQFGGVRIGGMSGIFKGKDFLKGHFEHPPYSEDTKRSAYHLRTIDVFRLKQLKQHVDIFLSHDWPRGIYKYGNVQQLLRKKKFFTEEIEKDILGNPVAMDMLLQLQPTYWFAAHLHVKFPAIVQHSPGDDGKLTKFLSLDKCLPRRQFLQVLDIPHDQSRPLKLELDAEWLSILKLTNSLLSLSRANHYPGGNMGERTSFSPTDAEVKSIINDFGGDLTIPENFVKTTPAFDPTLSKKQNNSGQPVTEVNPQTTLLCSMLDLTDPNAVFLGLDSTLNLPDDDVTAEQEKDENDKDDDVDDDEYESEPSFYSMSESERSFSDRSFSLLSTTGNESGLLEDNESLNSSVGNPDEIPLDSDKEDSEQMKLSPRKSLCNISLSEKLKNCEELSKSNSVSTSATSESSLEDEEELAEIMKAQKEASFTEEKTDGETEKIVSDNSSLNESSIDCRDLDINDDDAELREMLKAQKVLSESPGEKAGSSVTGPRKFDSLASSGDNCLIEASLDNDDIEFQNILSEQKKSDFVSNSDIQRDFQNLKPAYQSSPVPSIEDRLEQNLSSKDVSPRLLSGNKRGDVNTEQKQSPVTKKFRRRNQELYSDNSTGEEDAV